MFSASDKGSSKSFGSITNRQLVVAATAIALGTIIPFLFHGIKGAGPLFLPLYYPVIIASFLLTPSLAALTGLLTPVSSTVLTGMPPINPPIVLIMMIELLVLAGSIAVIHRRFAVSHRTTIFLAVLVNRVVYAGMLVVFAELFRLPAFSFSLVRVISSWPGLLIILLILPALSREIEKRYRESDFYAE